MFNLVVLLCLAFPISLSASVELHGMNTSLLSFTQLPLPAPTSPVKATVSAPADPSVDRNALGETGLRGLFPKNDAPKDLSKDVFEKLDGNWKDWSTKLSNRIATFYTDKELTVSEQRELIEKFRSAIRVMEIALQDRRYEAIFTQLTYVHGRLKRRVELWESMIRILEQTPASQSEKIRTFLKDFVKAVEGYETKNESLSAKKVQELIDELTQWNSQSATELQSVIDRNYRTYNLKATFSESLLKSLVDMHRAECGGINDCILGAHVVGNQSTNASIFIDLKPSFEQAHFQIFLSGRTNSQTSGTTPQAVVFTQGNHSFQANRSIFFNGQKFSTNRPYLQVFALNTNRGITTKLDGIPILEGIAQKIAHKKVAEKKLQSEYIAATKLYQKVYPRFETEGNEQIADANQLLQKLESRLADEELAPRRTAASSTEDLLFYQSETRSNTELSGTSSTLSVPRTGISLLVHESLLNNGLNRLKLEGRRLTDKELRDEFTKLFQKLLMGKTYDTIPPPSKQLILDGKLYQKSENGVYIPIEEKAADEKEEKDNTQLTIEFEKEDPIRIRFDEETIRIIMRGSFETVEFPGESDENKSGQDCEDSPKGTKRTFPSRRIEIPLKIEIEGDSLVLKQEKVKVANLAGKNTLGQRVTNRRLGTLITRKIPDRTIDRVLEMKNSQKQTLRLKIDSLEFLDHWARIKIQ